MDDRGHAASFFCGGSRNALRFLDLFDQVFVLEIDRDTLNRRLAGRPQQEVGAKAAQRDLIARLHATREDLPEGATIIDATVPLARVVDESLSKLG